MGIETGIILLPSRNRPDKVTRFIQAYHATKATLPVALVLDVDNVGAYEEVWRTVVPANWLMVVNHTPHDLNSAINTVFHSFPDAAFYGFMADDIVPQTEAWDVKLAEACVPHYIAWGDDGIRQSNAMDAPALCTHPFIGGDVARAWGWLASPYTNRHCQDMIWRDFYTELGIGKYLPDVVTKHCHWQTGEADFDVTYAEQPSAKEGHHQYWDCYKNSQKFKDDVQRVRERLKL